MHTKNVRPQEREGNKRAAGFGGACGTVGGGSTTYPPAHIITHYTPDVKYFLERGVPVLPCSGKVPNARLAPHGLNSATVDPTVVAQWHEECPDANWAVCTGELRTGPWKGCYLAVLDIEDVGVATALFTQTSIAKMTATTHTPSGGLHIYAISRQPVANAKIFWGEMEIGTCWGVGPDDGPGGYVLFHGRTDGGHYAFNPHPGIAVASDGRAWFETVLGGVHCRATWEEASDAQHTTAIAERAAEEVYSTHKKSLAGTTPRQTTEVTMKHHHTLTPATRAEAKRKTLSTSIIPKVQESTIPSALKQYPNWVTWRTEERDGKPTKVPYTPGTHRMASTTAPKTWGTFADALADFHNGRADGIGFVFTNSPFCGVDLDHCLDGDDGLDATAAMVVDRLNSYTERSPSGKGLHVIIRANLPPGRRRKGKIEVYDTGRYFTVTGDHWPGTPQEIEDRQAEIELVYRAIFGPEASRPEEGATPRPVDLDDQELLDRAMCADNGAKFARLWNGDISGYSSHSEADLALCSMLAFWTGNDLARIDRLFRQSGLYRDKWEREDYRQRTIRQALEGMTESYGSARKRPVVREGLATPAPTEEDEPALPPVIRDLAHAEALAILWRDRYRWAPHRGAWLRWTGKVWKQITEEQAAVAAARALPRHYAGLLRDAREQAEIVRLTTLIKETCSYSRLVGGLTLLCGFEGFHTDAEEWDADPWVLNVANGTIDLRTGELRPHNPADLCSKICPVEYHPDATDVIFNRYLADATRGDANFVAYLQRAVGYSLTGVTDEEDVFLVLGPGGSGKTTLIETLLATMGDYAHKASFSTFLARSGGIGEGDPPRPDLLRMHGTRLVAATEPEKGRRLAASVVKEMTGGDRVTARALYARMSITFTPTHKLWLSANAAPIMDDDDSGLWRRLKRLPFEHAIPEEKQDKTIKQHLTGPGRVAVLAWAVKGCLAWQKEGLRPPPVVKEKTEELRAGFDPLAEFLETRCVIGPGRRVDAKTLRTEYENWAQEVGAKPINNREWGHRLKAMGGKSIREKRGREKVTVWHGIGLLASDPSDCDF